MDPFSTLTIKINEQCITVEKELIQGVFILLLTYTGELFFLLQLSVESNQYFLLVDTKKNKRNPKI